MASDLDISFNLPFGYTINSFPNTTIPADDFGKTIILQPNGQIVMAGNVNDGTNIVVGLIRLNSNGSVDSYFGSGG
jgi:hypothetical protein